jgi:cytochrome d ubiquinol oxidase subunit II
VLYARLIAAICAVLRYMSERSRWCRLLGAVRPITGGGHHERSPRQWMPVSLLLLMGIGDAAYVILDGYDLGVGMLMHRASREERDLMIARIGPFWDANETWLVLGVGILLIAFPSAHGVVLTALYLPVALMLLGPDAARRGLRLPRQGARFHQPLWNRLFIAGSRPGLARAGLDAGPLTSPASSGGWLPLVFCGLIALALPAAYVLMGACWLVLKTEGPLQEKAVHWARIAWAPVVGGHGLISVATPLVSLNVRQRWFSMPEFLALLPIPLFTLVAFVVRAVGAALRAMHRQALLVALLSHRRRVPDGRPRLAYSLFPYVVMDRLTIWQAASAPKSLAFILVGCAIAVPAIAGYHVFAYRVFSGRRGTLSYG